jgi:hypothetical protein
MKLISYCFFSTANREENLNVCGIVMVEIEILIIIQCIPGLSVTAISIKFNSSAYALRLIVRIYFVVPKR